MGATRTFIWVGKRVQREAHKTHLLPASWLVAAGAETARLYLSGSPSWIRTRDLRINSPLFELFFQ